MLHPSRVFTLVLLSVGLASPSLAGMKRDIADCSASNRVRAAAACTRVMNSGRLPRRQFYIGYFNHGAAYRKGGNNKRALADFNRVVKLRPSFAKAYYVLRSPSMISALWTILLPIWTATSYSSLRTG